MELIKAFLFLLSLILFNLFLFIFINSNSKMASVIVPILLLLLTVLLIKTEMHIFIKMFPIAVLVIFPILITANNVLVTKFPENEINSVSKFSMLKEVFVNNANKIWAKSSFTKLETKNYIVYYPKSLETIANDVIRTQDYTYSMKSNYYKDQNSKKVDIYIFDKENTLFNNDFNKIGAIGRYLNGEIQLFYSNKNNDLLEQALVHEYVHFLNDNFKQTYKLNDDDIPMWIDEGLAEYARCKFIELNKDQGICYEQNNLNGDFPLDLLQTRADWHNLYKVDSAYYTSYMTVKALIENEGEDFLLKYLKLKK